MALSRARATAVGRSALAQVAELTGKDAEKVVSLRYDDGRWSLEIDVVDVHRIPDTTDILATYRVYLNDDGEVTELHRTRQYVRTWLGDQG